MSKKSRAKSNEQKVQRRLKVTPAREELFWEVSMIASFSEKNDFVFSGQIWDFIASYK